MLENFKPSDLPTPEENPFKIPDIKDLPLIDGESGMQPTDIKPLPPASKAKLKEQGYPDSVIDNIGSEEEKNIYENSGVTPKEVNERDALVKNDIDLTKEDDFGRTNLERMKQGLAPLDKDGNPIELHHVGQKMDSPLAELTRNEHRGKGNDTVLHNKQKESEINREDFAKERAEHWKARAEQLESEMNA